MEGDGIYSNHKSQTPAKCGRQSLSSPCSALCFRKLYFLGPEPTARREVQTWEVLVENWKTGLERGQSVSPPPLCIL